MRSLCTRSFTDPKRPEGPEIKLHHDCVMSALPFKADMVQHGSMSALCQKQTFPVHSMTSSALAIRPGERRSPHIESRLDNSEKVQPALDADTQAALTYAVRIQRNLRHRYHHKKEI